MEESSRTKVFKGFGKQTIVTVTLGVMGILYFSIMSRLLSKEDFGYFAIITAITAVITSLTEAGLGASLIQNKNADEKFVATASTMSICLGVLFMVFLIAFSGIFSKIMVGSSILKYGFILMSLNFIFHSINSIGKATIIKKLNFIEFGSYDIVSYLLSSIIGIYLAYVGYGFYATIIAMLLHQGFISIMLLATKNYRITFEFNKEYAQKIISYGGWLTGSVVIRNITQQLDRLITTNWIPVADLGAYNRPAGFISQITGQLNNIFDTILFPILSGINDSKAKINSSYEKCVSLVVLYSLVLTSVFILGSDVIISIFLGNKWLELSNIFQIISISIIFLCYGRIADCFFRSLGVVKSYFYTRCCVCLATSVCIYLGCQFGIVGLAIGLSFSRSADSLLKIFFLKPYISIKRKKYYLELLKNNSISVIAFAICYCFKSDTVISSLISVGLYLLIVMVFAIAFPKTLGVIYYQNIYLVIKSKIQKK